MINKFFLLIFAILTLFISCVSADNNQLSIDKNLFKNNTYISSHNYSQDPYTEMPSLSGLKSEPSESKLATQNVAEKWFSDGTWNVFGAASYYDQNGSNNYGYGVNLFGQTGYVAGFSFGGLFSVMNPVFSNNLNPANPLDQAPWLPINQQIGPTELFTEYRYNDLLQVDAGYIGIPDVPWMTYYQNNALNVISYQGVLVNISPDKNWRLTAFAINGAQFLGENGFSQQTLYDQTYDITTGTPNLGNASSSGSFAIGANWASDESMVDTRLWGYQFNGYSDLIYADTTINLPINDNTGFTLSAQGAEQTQNIGAATNNLNSSGYGSNVRSNMLGFDASFNYSIFGLQLAYNNIWGPVGSVNGGNIIAPYTYPYATDPLYTTGWIQGLIELTGGQAYKIAPSLNLLDSDLLISPSYEYFATTATTSTSEYDLQVGYNISQIKGFTIFGGYGYVTNNLGQGSMYQGQVFINYLY